MRKAAILLALGFLVITPMAEAGGEPTPGFRLLKETRHVRYFVERGTKVNVRKTEAFLERLLALFGPAPDDWRFDYYRYESIARLSIRIGFNAYGVTDLATSRIDSTLEFHPHELVHAVTGRLGRPPVFFTEGIAVALTSRGRWHGWDQAETARAYLAERRGLYELIVDFGGRDPERDYAVAGSFVAYLLDRYGIDPLIDFLVGCGEDGGRYETALHSAYGTSLGQLEWDWSRSLARPGTPVAHDWYEPRGWPQSLRTRTASRSSTERPAQGRRSVASVTAPAVSAADTETGRGTTATVVADVWPTHEDQRQ